MGEADATEDGDGRSETLRVYRICAVSLRGRTNLKKKKKNETMLFTDNRGDRGGEERDAVKLGTLLGCSGADEAATIAGAGGCGGWSNIRKLRISYPSRPGNEGKGACEEGIICADPAAIRACIAAC